ncbi:hypothetical protein quinque_007898 [Culex quinquefasciatus]
MGLWPLNAAEMLQNSTSGGASAPSLQNLSLQAFIRSLPVEHVATQIESLPTKVMINALEELCYSDRYQWKIVKCVQYMETERTNYVDQLTKNVAQEESLDFESSLRLGSFLAEAGWYREAIQVFEVALGLADGQPLRQLEVMSQMLVSQVLTKHSEVERSGEVIRSMMTNLQVPAGLRISVNHAISAQCFEKCMFEDSHRYAVEAFQDLNHRTSPKQVIQIFSHLSKTCIPLKLFRQAKLLITQAVSLAWYHYGSPSIVYARALEDYALYLVTMNAVEDGMNTFSEAQQTLLQLYGPRNLQQTVTQGNLCFGVYLQAYIYRDLTMAKRYLRNIAALMEELNPADRRLLVAIGQADALAEADVTRVGGGRERDLEQRDRFEEILPVLKIAQVQRLFEALK